MLKLKVITIAFVIFSCVIVFADEVDDFIADSRSGDRRVRANYAELLGNYKDERVFTRLIELVQDKDSYVRWKAADSLAKFGDKRAVPILKEVLKKTKGEEDLRDNIGEALYKLGDKTLIPFWIESLDEQNPWLTELFVRAMVDYDYRGREASEILIKDLESKDERVKICAAYALAYTKEPKAYEGLIKLLVDNSFGVKQMAILALGHIGNKEATPYLLLALNDENTLIRIAAYHSLYRLADSRAAFGVIDALNKEKDDHLRQYAVVTLGKLKNKNAVPILLAILDEKETAGTVGKRALKADAIKALGEIGDKSAKKRLEELFKEMTSPNAPHFYSSGSGGGGRGSISSYIPYLDKDFPLTYKVSSNPLAYQTFSVDRILSDPLYEDNIGVIIKKSLQKIESADEKLLPSAFSRAEYDTMMQKASANFENLKPAYFDSLVEQLKNSENQWERQRAAEKLGALKDKKAIPHLIEALNDSSEYVRSRAAKSLGELDAKEAVLTLKGSFLHDKEGFVRREAGTALGLIADSSNDQELLKEILVLRQDKEITSSIIGALGQNKRKNCLPLLFECLQSDNPNIRRSALGAIGTIGDEEILPKLLSLLQSEDKDMQIESIRLFGRYKYKEAVEPLIKMFDKSDERTKSVIVISLKQIADPRAIPLLKEAVRDESQIIQSEARGALDALGQRSTVIEELKAALEDKDFNKRKEALQRLIDLKGEPEAFLILNRLLDDKDVRIRRLAALAIPFESRKKSVPILVDMLKEKKLMDDYLIFEKTMYGKAKETKEARSIYANPQLIEDMFMVDHAISDLSIMGAKEASDTFIELLNYDLTTYTRLVLIGGLGKMGDRKAIASLKPFLADDETRQQAAIALGKLGDKDALPLLLPYLKEGVKDVNKWELVEAFVGIGEPSVPHLIKALDSNDPKAKEIAIHSLGHVGDKSAVPYLVKLIDEDNPKLTSDIIRALGRLGDKKALPALIGLYNSKKLNLRKEIIFAFSGLPDNSIRPLLFEVARDKNADLESRSSAIRTLGEIKDEEVIPFLEKLLKSENRMVQLNAAYALCKTGKLKYESYLIEGLQDENLADQAFSLLIDLKGEDAIPIIEESIKNKSDIDRKLMRNFLEQIVHEIKEHKK